VDCDLLFSLLRKVLLSERFFFIAHLIVLPDAFRCIDVIYGDRLIERTASDEVTELMPAHLSRMALQTLDDDLGASLAFVEGETVSQDNASQDSSNFGCVAFGDGIGIRNDDRRG
jgi:hypothetical protein